MSTCRSPIDKILIIVYTVGMTDPTQQDPTKDRTMTIDNQTIDQARYGGRRPGAGRKAGGAWAGKSNKPHVKKVRQRITLDADLIDWLRDQPNGVSGTLQDLAEKQRQDPQQIDPAPPTPGHKVKTVITIDPTVHAWLKRQPGFMSAMLNNMAYSAQQQQQQ
jgi:hypothetical protein